VPYWNKSLHPTFILTEQDRHGIDTGLALKLPMGRTRNLLPDALALLTAILGRLHHFSFASGTQC